MVGRDIWNTHSIKYREHSIQYKYGRISIRDHQLVLLFAKHFIHCCKWSNHLPITELLKAELKNREKVEKYTAVITGDLIKHEEKWSKWLNNIG